MATMEKATSDSDIYEDTDVLPPSGTNAPQAIEANTLYQALRFEEGMSSQVQAVTRRRGKCYKRRWWIGGAIVGAIMCIGLSLVTGWLTGTTWARNKPDGVKDNITYNQEITQLSDTLQEQVENVIALKFAEMERALEERMAERTKLKEIQNITENTLDSRLTELERIIKAVQTELSAREIETRLTELERIIKAVQTELSAREIENHVEGDVFIGFTAWKTTPQNLSSGENVIYEELTINEGGHYKPLTGQFKCPVDGIYLAYTTVKADGTSYLRAGIVKNSEFCAHIYRTRGSQPWNTVTNSCLMECKAGEYIAVESITSMSVYGDASVPYSSFSVIMMLQQGDELLHQGFDGSSAAMDGVQSYSQGDTVQFPTIMHNSGSYSPSTSEYTCREDGIYFVMVTLMRRVTRPLYAAVEYDSDVVLSLTDDVSSIRFNQISNSVLLSCAAEEIIAVKATSDTDIHDNDPGNKYSTFTVMFMGQEGSFLSCSVWKSSTQDYSAGDTIEYDQVALNIGGHFHPATNKFICPAEAIYYVTATAKKSSTGDLQINIMHESTTLFRLEDLVPDNLDNTISNSAVVRCGAQEVIQVKAAGSGSVYGSTGGIFTTLNVMKMS